jgi:hypothetical protein
LVSYFEHRKGVINKMGIRSKVGLAIVFAAVSSVLGAAVAFAQTTIPADPTGGTYASGVTGVQTWISSVGAGPLFGLAAFALIIAVALHYFRKGKSAASG